MEFGRVVTCDVCLQWSDVCRGTTIRGFDLFGDRARIRTIGFDDAERWTGRFGFGFVSSDGEDIKGVFTVFFPKDFVLGGVVVVWLSFNLLRNVLLEIKKWIKHFQVIKVFTWQQVFLHKWVIDF